MNSSKEEKILNVKADAFDQISNLQLTLDSHRNFHRRVTEIIVHANQVCRDIANSKSGGEQFPQCERCGIDFARCTVAYTGGNELKVCNQCADILLANVDDCKKVVISEEQVVLPEDLQ